MPSEIESVILDNRLVARDTCALWLYAPDIAHRAQPGQFVMLGIAGKFLRRPLSIAGTDGGRILLLVRIVGEGTASITALRRNQRVPVLGSLGNAFPDDIENPVLVGGGIGIAPLLFAVQSMISSGKEFSLLYGEQAAENLIAGEFLPDETQIATDDGSAGFCGTVSDLLKEFPPAPILACGPEPMLRSIARIAKKRKVSAWLSLETHMACGFGVCHGCVVHAKSGYLRVCSDGPIFPAEALWD